MAGFETYLMLCRPHLPSFGGQLSATQSETFNTRDR